MSFNDDLVSVKLKRHKDKNGNHHHVILEDVDDKHVSVGLTTQKKKGRNSNSTNYCCNYDVVGNGQQSYMRRQAIVDYKRNYYAKKDSLMPSSAYKQAQIYGDRAKEKYLTKKKETQCQTLKEHQPGVSNNSAFLKQNIAKKSNSVKKNNGTTKNKR